MIKADTKHPGGYAERRWTSSDGLSLFSRDYPAADGSAQLPVICLHGLTRNSSDFDEVAPWIASLGRRVIVPDVRGRGESEWDGNTNNYVPRIYARDVIELLNALDIARAAFIGTSMGGIIMMMLALRHRKRIAAAVLNDVGPEVAPEGLERIQSYAGKPVELKKWADAVAYVRGINEIALPHLSDADWERMAQRTFERGKGAPKLKYDAGISAALTSGKAKVPSFLAWWMYKRLSKGRPTLVIRGETSDILSRATALRMANGRPNVEVVEVPGVGHAPMLNEPASQEALASFLQKVP